MTKILLKNKKEIIKRKWFIKNEIKKKILKSIIQNTSLTPINRLYASWTLIHKHRKGYISKQNKICLVSSKYRGIQTKFFLSRHFIKKLGNWNELQNIKVKSW